MKLDRGQPIALARSEARTSLPGPRKSLWGAALALLVAACQPPGGSPTRPAPSQQFTLTKLVGGWRWIHRTTEDGTTRIEDEEWRFHPQPGSMTRLAGRYIRTVEVRSDDRAPFLCNQRPWYRQRAAFDVTVDIAVGGFTITETAHRAEPTPCDHGFRHLGSYAATLGGERLTLRWDTGAQTLWQIDHEFAALPDEPWPADVPIRGRWRWDSSSFDDEGNIHDESEWWEIAERSELALDATYRRRVVVRSPDNTPIPCAGAASWTFDDAYVLEAARDEAHWRFRELAAQPGDHPCLRANPRRTLDEATAEQIGEHLILEWRGKRRQVLYRDQPLVGPAT